MHALEEKDTSQKQDRLVAAANELLDRKTIAKNAFRKAKIDEDHLRDLAIKNYDVASFFLDYHMEIIAVMKKKVEFTEIEKCALKHFNKNEHLGKNFEITVNSLNKILNSEQNSRSYKTIFNEEAASAVLKEYSWIIDQLVRNKIVTRDKVKDFVKANYRAAAAVLNESRNDISKQTSEYFDSLIGLTLKDPELGVRIAKSGADVASLMKDTTFEKIATIIKNPEASKQVITDIAQKNDNCFQTLLKIALQPCNLNVGNIFAENYKALSFIKDNFLLAEFITSALENPEMVEQNLKEITKSLQKVLLSSSDNTNSTEQSGSWAGRCVSANHQTR